MTSYLIKLQVWRCLTVPLHKRLLTKLEFFTTFFFFTYTNIHICHSYSYYDSVTVMQSNLGLRSLEQRRADASVIMLYKISTASLPFRFQRTLSSLPNSQDIAIPMLRQIHTTANYYKYSFFPLSIVYWNSLPTEVVMLPTLDQCGSSVPGPLPTIIQQ